MSLREGQMKQIRKIVQRLAMLALAASLAGCGGGDGIAALNPFDRDTIDLACPPLGSLKEAETLTRFRPGGGRDLTDVMFEARIGRVVGKCQVTQSKNLADVKAGVELFAERGPVLATNATEIEYFIAIRAPDGRIVGRQGFTLPLEFSEGLRDARAVDLLTFEIPNATPEALRSYRIFFGLQMTEEEWAFNQRDRRSR